MVRNVTELTDEDIDKIIKEEIIPDITNNDSISKDVDDRLGEMGFLWDVVRKKLEEDKICFDCKKTINLKTENIEVIQVKTEKGIVAFASLCKKCHKKALENDGNKDSTKKD